MLGDNCQMLNIRRMSLFILYIIIDATTTCYNCPKDITNICMSHQHQILEKHLYAHGISGPEIDNIQKKFGNFYRGGGCRLKRLIKRNERIDTLFNINI